MESPVVVAAAIIQRNNTVLIAKRGAHGRFAGLWEFPGGKAELGEDLHACLMREIKEELGVDVLVGEEFSMIRYDYGAQEIVHLHGFFCQLVAGEPQPLVHEELRWVAIEDFVKYEFVPADIQIVHQLEFKFCGTMPIHLGGTKAEHLAAARAIVEVIKAHLRAYGTPDNTRAVLCPQCREIIGIVADAALPEKMVDHELARCPITHSHN